MRKVKAAAVFLCLASVGIFGGFAPEYDGLTVARTDQSAQIVEITAEQTTAACAQNETTTAVHTTTNASSETETTVKAETTAKAETTTVRTETTAVETTSEAVYETQAEKYLAGQLLTSAVEFTVTTTTVQMTAAETEPTSAVPATTVQTTAETDTETAVPALSVTEEEYIMLCNIVGHEYGGAFVPVEEKALVVEVIMNRVHSPLFPNTVYEVLTQPNQFTGLEYLIEMDTMSYYVTDSVRAAVDLYLSDSSQFQHGYLFFSGDGIRNYFRTEC